MTAPWEDYAQGEKGPWDDFKSENSAQVAPTAGLRSVAAKPEVEGGFVPAAKQMVGMTIKGAGQLAADIIPDVGQDNPVIQYGQEVIEANPTAVQGLRDIVRRPGKTVTEATGNAVPSVLGMVGIRAFGQGVTALAPFTGPAAPVVAGTGQAISWLGPLAVAGLPSYSGIRDKQIFDDPEAQTSAKDKAVAALGAATVGAIEQRFGPQNWALAAMTKEGRARVADMLASTTLRGSIAKGALRGAAAEGSEELVQNPVEQVASYQNPLTRQSLEETATGGIMGAVGGGVLGGGFGLAGRRQQITQEQNPTKDAVQQQTLSKLFPSTDIIVADGVATVQRSGDPAPFQAPIDDILGHLKAGGTIDSFVPAETTTEVPASTPEQEFETGSLRYRQNANRPRGFVTGQPGEGEGLRSRVPGRTVEEVQAEEAAYQNQQVFTPGSPEAAVQEFNRSNQTDLRYDGVQRGLGDFVSYQFTDYSDGPIRGATFNTTAITPEAISEAYNKKVQQFTRSTQNAETVQGNQEQPAQEGVAVQGVQDEGGQDIQQPTQERPEAGVQPQEVRRASGQPFASENAVKGALTRQGLNKDDYEITQVEGGYVAAPKADFSVGQEERTNITVQQAETEVRNFLGSGYDRMTRLNKLGIVQTKQELPQGIQLKSADRRVLGVYNRDTGKITLVAEALRPGDAEYVLRHEGMHMLLREDREFSSRRERILRDFSKMKGESVEAAFARVPEFVAEDMRAEEALGYWLQNPENHKHSLFKRIVAAVKAGLRRLGIPAGSYTDAELARMFTRGLQEFAREGSSETTYVGSGGNLYSQEQVQEAAQSIYSKLRRVARSKFQGMKAQGVMNFLTKHGVKKAEMEAVGLQEWLQTKKPTDKVSREELSEFVRANTVELEDVVLSDDGYIATNDWQRETVTKEDQHWAGQMSDRDNPDIVAQWYPPMDDTPVSIFEHSDGKFEVIEDGTSFGEFPTLEAAASRAGVKTSGTQFAQYQEPGGENYREMFVTAPGIDISKPVTKEFAKEYFGITDEDWNQLSTEDKQSYADEINEKQKKNWRDGHSAYADIQNPIVRIRFNERTDSEGRKILFIEEMQGPNPSNQNKMPGYLKDNIYNLGVKRILAYAKQNGFDGVAWTTGEMQIQRYEESVRKHIGKIIYAKRDNGEYRIIAFDPQGYEVLRDTHAPEDIEKTYGKELSKKILNNEGKETGIIGNKELSGLDLKVGGEGLKRLYDQTLPDMFKAYGKGKVGETRIETKYPSFNLVASDGTVQEEGVHSEERAEELKVEWEAETGKTYEITRAAGGTDVPFLPITQKTPSEFPMFSLANDGIQRGQSFPKQAIDNVLNPKSKLKELYEQYAPQWLSVTPLNTLVQTFGKTIPQIRAFAKHLDSVVSTKTELVDHSAVLYEQAEELAEKGVGVQKLNYAAATASFNRMIPWAGILEQDWVPSEGTKEKRLAAARNRWNNSKMKEATGLTYDQAYRQARDAYEALKSNDLKEAYIKIVEHLKSIRTRERNNLLAYIENNSEEGSDLRNQLMQQFNNSFRTINGAYWPLARVGDFRLEYTDTEGFRVVEHFTTVAQRRSKVATLIEDGINPETIRQDYKNKQPRGAVNIPQELLGQLAATVEAKYLENVDPENDAAVSAARQNAQAVVDDMNQIWLRWQPETSALKSSIRRGNVKGFSEDMLRSYLEYIQHHAGNIAWTEQGRKIEDTIKEFADAISEQQKKPNADTTMQRHLLNDLRARVQALRSVNVGVVASTLGKLSTAYYMTSPSIALVQMSQLGVLTLPKLSTTFGWGPALKSVGRWTKEAFSKKYTRTPMFADPEVNLVFENLRLTVTDENRNTPQARGKALGENIYSREQLLAQINKLSAYQKRLLVLREAMARNLLDISAAHEAYELTRGKNPKNLRSRIFRYAMIPMSLSELTSRKAAVLATYELASNKDKNFFQAMNDVADVVNDTLYSYAKENKGAAMQGGLSRVILQFQHYRIMTGIRLAMIFNNMVRGETQEARQAARKEFIGIMGMAGAFGGTLGLPLANVVFAALDAILGDDDEPVDSKLIYRNWLQENFGDTMASVIATGTPSLAGADLSRRTGLGDIYGFQQSPPPGMHGRQLAAWWAASQIGPVFSVGQSWVQGYDEMVRKGNYLKGLEVASPKPIRDGLKAHRLWAEGLKTGAGKQLLSREQITPEELMLLALGFNTDEVSKAQAAEASLRKISTQISERRGRLTRLAARAILEGGDTSDELELVRNFNRKMPRFGITGSDILSAARSMLRGERGITGPREQLIEQQYGVPEYLEY